MRLFMIKKKFIFDNELDEIVGGLDNTRVALDKKAINVDHSFIIGGCHGPGYGNTYNPGEPGCINPAPGA